MMYLSLLHVDTGSDPDRPRPGRLWLRQTYRVHQRLWMAFPDAERRGDDPFFLGQWDPQATAKGPRSRGGFLFRVEPDYPPRILVQSVEPPDWAYAFQNAPYLLVREPQVRGFEPEYAVGTTYRFRLIEQMVSRQRDPAQVEPASLRRGRPVERPILCQLENSSGAPPRADPSFTAWRERLLARASALGFEIAGRNLELLRVSPAHGLRRKPDGDTPAARIHAALFEGAMVCTDAARLREAVILGVGRGKAFGCGLLSVARA